MKFLYINSCSWAFVVRKISLLSSTSTLYLFMKSKLFRTPKKDAEQIFLTIQKASERVKGAEEERTLTMPIFSVKSELNVENYLKNVRKCLFFSLCGRNFL